ncbi:MAG TPA: hypothetical protein VK919_03975 [Solirubrobacterales bacterium]|nr:hypothetical protein [Solirubrobacterales bacterium]
MTRQRSFKRLVRARMEKTGESYTAARAILLAGDEARGTADVPLVISDEGIRERTGRGWEEWFDLLDDWGGAERSHTEIARHVATELGIDPLAWNAQAVTVSYERGRGLRAVGERADGFAASASKTVAVPVGRLFDAVVDGSRRKRWLDRDRLHERTATRPKSARFDWDGGETRVTVTFTAKGDHKSALALEHVRLADADEAERMKAFWRGHLTELKSALEGGEIDA